MSVNFNDTNTVQSGLNQLVNQDNVKADALTGDDETLERLVYQQIGGVAEGGTAAEIAAKKADELRTLVGKRRGIDKNGDKNVDSEVGFSEQKRFLRKPSLVITEYAFSTNSAADKARQAELQALWNADQADSSGFGTLPTASASLVPTTPPATGGTAPQIGAKAPSRPTEPGFYTARSSLLTAWNGTGDVPKYKDDTTWGGEKDALYSDEDKVIARTKGMPGDLDEQQRAALYSDVTSKKGTSGEPPLAELTRVEEQYKDSQDKNLKGHSSPNPYIDDYKVMDAKSRYESRLTSLSNDDKQKAIRWFDKAIVEKEREAGHSMTDEEKMSFVNQFGNLKGEDLAKGVKGQASGSDKRGSEKLSEEALERFGETYKTDPEKEGVTNSVNDYLQETFDNKIAEEEAKLSDSVITDAQKAESEAKIAKLQADRTAQWQKINDNIGNPKRLKKILGKDKEGNEYFNPSKAQIASANKETPNVAGGAYGQATRGLDEGVKQFNTLKGLYEGGKGIVEGIIAIGEKPLAGLKEVRALVDKDNTTVSAMANEREIDKEATEYETRRKGAAGIALEENGVSAGVAPTAEAGNMLASLKSIRMANPSPNGKKPDERTEDLQNLADQASLNRRLQRATV